MAVVELPLMPIFFSSAPDDTPGRSALHQKRRELLAADFGEDGEQIRRAAVGDPHLLAVEHVVRAVGAQIGARLQRHRVRSRMRLAQAVRADHLRRSPASADTSASAPRCRTAARAAFRFPHARHASRSTIRRAPTPSATIIAEMRSISMPPYFSGTIDRQSVRARRTCAVRDTATPGS